MADLDRKRKRADEGRPGKMVTIADPPVAKITPFPNEDHWAPLLVSSPGLELSRFVGFKPHSRRRKNAPSRAGFSGAIAIDEMLLHSSDHQTLDYVGREEDAGGHESLLKHYVGVYDPEDHTLQVMEARKMIVRGIVRSHEAGPDAFKSKMDFMSQRDLRNDLGQIFGTKKAKKAIASITENAITSSETPSKSTLRDGTIRSVYNSATAALLAEMTENTKGMATKEELASMVNASKPRPDINLDATEPSEVYSVASVIGTDVYVALSIKDWQDALRAKKEVTCSSKFVANRLAGYSKNSEKLKLMRFLAYIMDFWNLTVAKRGIRLLKSHDEQKQATSVIPNTIMQGIKQKFTVNGREMTKFNQNYFRTTACVLALMIDDFTVDITDLQEDLQLESKDMRTYFREIGAKVGPPTESESKKNGWDKAAAARRQIAKLKLPLDLPVERRRATAKKR